MQIHIQKYELCMCVLICFVLYIICSILYLIYYLQATASAADPLDFVLHGIASCSVAAVL